MKSAVLTVVAMLALIGPARSDNKSPVNAQLPREPKVKWDLDVFEKSPAFHLVKREVKDNQVVWILENRRDLGTEIVFGFQAAFFDEDGVKMFTTEFETEPSLLNMSRGERNRFTLHLPREEKWSLARKVVIKNGLYR
jgi:hypothetical protein